MVKSQMPLILYACHLWNKNSGAMLKVSFCKNYVFLPYLLEGCTNTEFISLEITFTGAQGEESNGAAAEETVDSSMCRDKRSRKIDENLGNSFGLPKPVWWLLPFSKTTQIQGTKHTTHWNECNRHLRDRNRIQLLLASCPNSIQSSLTYSIAYFNKGIIKSVIKEDYFQTKINKQHVFINQSKTRLLLKTF